LSKNSSLVVSLFDSTYVDLTPLPFFHQYSIREWQFFIHHFFENYEINLDNIKLDVPFFNMTDDRNLKLEGELLFAIETLLFSLIEMLAPETLKILKNKEKNPIKINGLLNPSLALSEIDLFDCIKIKIRPTLENNQLVLKSLKDIFLIKPQMKIRLDGNLSFTLSELVNYLTLLEKELGLPFIKSLEYIEDPFKISSERFLFSQIRNYPIALDESFLPYIHLKNFSNLASLPKKSFLILKPSLLGLSTCFKLTQLLGLDNTLVISSTYEFPRGFSPFLFLARLGLNTFHGFDTQKYLPIESPILIF
jgi:hypothetical protein